ncbi:proteasome accessory factor PafA2 [Ornithinimicrobium sp. Arc0846-15]|nr:proteasome accessory factor PafA2 [Ornithinimicrobium laminariae]
MTVRRVMGIETEYGVALPGQPAADPIMWSGRVVQGYVRSAATNASLPLTSGWDYADETPLRDARGFSMARALADVSQLTDVDDPMIANSVLSNGARLYVDHAHPEYSSPEVMSPLDAVRWDRAGELVMRQAADHWAQTGEPVRLYKNNVDGKGASYGTHDNYLVPRSVPFADLISGLLPFLIARPAICGAGRVGLGVASQGAGFQISARADYIEAEVGLETTLKRPIVNTRDEPHASPSVHRRLHLITGDATCADVGTLLKVGSTSAVLRLIESDRHPRIELVDPVAGARTLSRDPSFAATVLSTDGQRLSALDILEAYLVACREAVADEAPGWVADSDTQMLLERWQAVLDQLRVDPSQLGAQLDWVAKWNLLRGFKDRDDLSWNDPRLQLIDIQYSDVDLSRGLAAKLRAAGRLESLVSDEAVRAAMVTPPLDTRAWFRGACVARFGADVKAASWDSVVLLDRRSRPQRVGMPEPEGGTESIWADRIASSTTSADLLEHLSD